MVKGWGKIGVVILEPKIKNDKLNTFTAKLIKSNIPEEVCRKAEGIWEQTVLGGSCTIPVAKVADVSVQDMVFGRAFTDLTAPTERVVTKEGVVQKKGKARFQFDCGEGTEELFVRVADSEGDLKNMDIRCFEPPVEMMAADIQVITPRGAIASFRDIDKLREMV